MKKHPRLLRRKPSPRRGDRSPPGRPLPRHRPSAIRSHAGNAAFPLLPLLPSQLAFSSPLSGRRQGRAGGHRRAASLSSGHPKRRHLGPWSAAQPDRTPPQPLHSPKLPPASPRTNPPLQRSATFQSKSGRERGGRGAWWRRKGSFCSKSQEEEIHFLNTLPVAAPFFFSLSPSPPFFFSANALNERVASSTQNPFDVLAHIYIYLRVRGVSKLTQEGQLYSKTTCKCCKVS